MVLQLKLFKATASLIVNGAWRHNLVFNNNLVQYHLFRVKSVNFERVPCRYKPGIL